MKKIVVLHEKFWVFALLVFFAVICLSSIRKNSLTYDEGDHLQFGMNALVGKLDHASMQRMPVTALNALPRFLIQKTKLQLNEQDMDFLCRIPTMLFAVLLGLLIFSWSKKLYGVQGGLLSLFLYVFCPNIIAHARLATTDVYCCVFMVASLYAFRKYVRQNTTSNLLLLSVAVGAAQLTKQTALLLFPLMAALGCIEIIQRSKKQGFHFKKIYLSHFFLFIAVILLIINIGYAFRGSFKPFRQYREWAASENPELAETLPANAAVFLDNAPIPLPAAYVEAFLLGKYYNTTGRGHAPVYLMGRIRQEGFWHYFLVAFLLKTPVPTMVLLALAFATRKTDRLIAQPDEIALIAAAGLVFFFFSFFSTAQTGIRYILPVYPLLYVFAGRLMTRNMRRLKKSIAAALSLYLIVSSMSYYPHYISYFNELCRDRTTLYKYLADSNIDWGQNKIYLEEYLKLHSNENIQVSPKSISPGKIIVRVNDLVGITDDAARYKILRDSYKPAGHIAHSWLIYEIPGKQPD